MKYSKKKKTYEIENVKVQVTETIAVCETEDEQKETSYGSPIIHVKFSKFKGTQDDYTRIFKEAKRRFIYEID